MSGGLITKDNINVGLQYESTKPRVLGSRVCIKREFPWVPWESHGNGNR